MSDKNKEYTALMYHGIIGSPEDVPPDREVGAELYDVSLENFCKQMAFLQEENYIVTTLRDDAIGSQKNIILTFDDGERNNFTHAFDMLNGFGFPAYFFVTVSRVGTDGYMNWEQITELRDANMIVGSHGFNHEILSGLKTKELEKELMRSKDLLEQNLKVNVDSLSVPRGFCDERIRKVALDAGYAYIFISDSNPLEGCVERVPIRRSWNLSRFRQGLSGGMPVAEKIFHSGKSVAKNMLGGKVYDNLRTFILKKKK